MTINFVGPGTKLADTDLPRIGHEIGVGEDEVHAILDVETRGSGFDDQNRPIILFEPHVFYRNLEGAQRDQAVADGIAYPRWGEKPYPHDSYPHLLQAIAINETAALKAASWGLGQVLGENYISAGFKTVQDMVTAFVESEANQLQGMIDFIKNDHLDGDLRAHNWAAFARGYNGAAYAKNAYDIKLAQAYAKWARIPDTPWSPNVQPSLAQTLGVPQSPPVTMPSDSPQTPVQAVPVPQVPIPPPDPRTDSTPSPQPASSGFFSALAALFAALFRRN